MEQMKYRITWKTILLPLIGIAGFIVYLYLFNVDIPLIISTLGGIDVTIYCFAAALIFAEVLFFALAWRELLQFLKVKLSVLKSYLYVWYGTFVDIIIPAESVSNEVTRFYLVTREQSGTEGRVVASLLTQRLIGMGINIASLILGILLVLNETSSVGHAPNISLISVAIIIAVVTMVFLALIVLLCVQQRLTLKLIDGVIGLVNRITCSRWNLEKYHDGAVSAARMFHDSMKEFGHAPKALYVSSILHLVSWAADILVAYLVFASIGYAVGWGTVILTASLVIAIHGIPVGIPFEVGIPEGVMTTVYILLGVPPGLAATTTILTRILTVWLKFFVGFASQQWLEYRAMRVPTGQGMPLKIATKKT